MSDEAKVCPHAGTMGPQDCVWCSLDAERARANEQTQLYETCRTTRQRIIDESKAIAMERDEWKARAEKAEEGQNALAAEVRKVRERAEAAEAALAKAEADLLRTQEGMAALDHLRITEKDEMREAVARVVEERDTALKACAEMRQCVLKLEAEVSLRGCEPLTHEQLDAESSKPREKSACWRCRTKEWFARALSSNAGKGYAAPDEQRALMERAWDDGRSFGGDEAVMATKKSASEQRALDLAALLGREG